MSEYESLPPGFTGPNIDIHNDFVSFLAAAQLYKTEFLTVTWQPALDPLGQGATAEVSQSSVVRGLGFAFKRTDDEFAHPLSGSYKYMVSELLALESPRVKAHPNVLTLVGVCWEIRRSIAVPVLVFPKAEFGDLRSYDRTLGQTLDFNDRCQLCVQVARGLLVLHESGIVHGDIKPQNILIDGNKENEYLAQLSDLGYSAIGRDEELVRLPHSRVWTDPNWNRREFKMETAKKMDIFSFGMLCLWLMFKDQVCTLLQMEDDLPDTTIADDIFFISNEAPPSKLEELQANDDLLHFTEKIISSAHQLETAQQSPLNAFFRGSLCKDVASRQSDMTELIRLLELSTSEVPPVEETLESKDMGVHLEHGTFRLSSCNYRLCTSDYRVRSTIFSSLEARTNIQARSVNYCEECRKLAALQLAICYRIGFGVPKDYQKSQHYLQISCKKQAGLDQEIQNLRERRTDSTLTESDARVLFDLGFLTHENLIGRYREDNIMSEAKSVYSREIEDMGAVLGEHHSVVLMLKSTLVLLLGEIGDLFQAEQFGVEVMHAFQNTLGLDHTDTIRSMENLAEVWVYQRRFEKASKLQEDIVALRSSAQGRHHGVTLIAIVKLATTYRTLGRLNDAENLEREAVQDFENIYGDDHPQTLEAKERLALTLVAQGQAEEALSIQEVVVATKRRVLGPENQSTVLTTGNLAPTYEALGQWHQAETLYLEVLDDLRKSLGRAHHTILIYEERLIGGYIRQNDYQKAERRQKDVVDEYREAKGGEDPQVLSNLANLARIYALQNKFDDAEVTLLLVLSRCDDIIASKTPESFPALSLAANVYILQRNYAKAEELLLKILPPADGTTYPLTHDTIANLSDLAYIYLHQAQTDKAQHLYAEALRVSKTMYGEEHYYTIEMCRNLAVAHYNAGEAGVAKDIHNTIREIVIRKQGTDNEQYISIASSLSSIYRRESNWNQAEPLTEELVSVMTRLKGESSPETLEQKRILARIYKNMKRWPDAEYLMKQLFNNTIETEAASKEEVFVAGAEVFYLYKKQEKWSDAISLIEDHLLDVADASQSLISRAELASCYAAKQELRQAFYLHETVVSDLKDCPTVYAHRVVLGTLEGLAACYAGYGLWAKAEELFKSIVEDSTNFLGAENDLTVILQSNLEVLQRAIRDAESA